jgi:OOP family OmpA-OmpF porin
MKNFLTAFLVFIVWSFFGLWLYSWLEPDSNTNIAKVEITNEEVFDVAATETYLTQEGLNFEEALMIVPLENQTESKIEIGNEKIAEKGLIAITEGGETVFQYTEGLNIKKNTAAINVPASVSNFKEVVRVFLEEHPDKEVHIISLYAVTENNESPNFGTQRGKDVKRLLVNDGVPSEKIVVTSVIRDLKFSQDLIYNNSISFTFRPLDQVRIEAILPVLPNRMVVYPKFTWTQINENKNLKRLVVKIEEALELNPNLSIEVIGHTDNIGSAAENYQLGLGFARQVRTYILNKSSIKKSQIKSGSKGESESIETNSTPRGRLANQRIEVVFY